MKQLECRIIITHQDHTFSLGMYDPVSMRYAPLGTHSIDKIEPIVRDLRIRMEKERHIVTFSEMSAPR